jgi:glycosyltransferase involved in cell wall biosynthesis
LPARNAFSLGRTLVVPSRAESFPYIVLEAGAAGIPLLTTGVGGIPEMLNGTEIPMLPAGDATELARHMAEALERPATLDVQARRFRDVVTERYTVSGMTGAILDFYAARHPALLR